MATRSETRDRKTSSQARNARGSTKDRSAFSFGDLDASDVAPILGALAAGAAIGIGANWARKFLMQTSESMAAGNQWDEILKLEHKATLAKFDLLLATDDSETGKRTALVKALHYGLNKH